jgi:hypothetical protein
MASRSRIALILVAAATIGITGPLIAQNPTSPQTHPAKPNYDIRIGRAPAMPSPGAAAELGRLRSSGQVGRSRLDANTGALRVLAASGWFSARRGTAASLGSTLAKSANRLGLDNADLGSLRVVRDYVSASTGLRHVIFEQSLDGIPVFGGVVSVHVADSGEIVRVTSGAASGAARRADVLVSAEQAAMLASEDIRPGEAFAAIRVEGPTGAHQAARFARGAFRREVSASLVWFAMDGGARLAWHVQIEPDAPQFYDLLIDAASGELLLRGIARSTGTGPVAWCTERDPGAGSTAAGSDAVGAAGCPPPQNLELRDLTVPFRDSATVLGTPVGSRATTPTCFAATRQPRAHRARSTARDGYSISRSTPPARPRRRCSSR